MVAQTGESIPCVRLRFFALYRDLAGFEAVEKCLDKPVSIEKLLEDTAPRVLEALRSGSPYIVLINGVPSSISDLIEHDCEIAIVPPPSGGSDDVSAEFFEQDLDLTLLKDLTLKYGPLGAGALAVFIGFVKGVVDGKRVLELVYEAYEPYASQKLYQIASEASTRPGIYAVHIRHRKGSARPGEPTLIIAVVGESRHIATDTLSWILERVKHEVPVFKLERREDGEFWVVGDGKRIPRESS